MNFFNIFYLSLLCINLGLSLWCLQNDKSIRILSILLGLSILTEVTVYIMYYGLKLKPEFFIAYHVYIPFEYTLISLYFSYHITSNLVKRIIKASIPVFITASIVISIYKGPTIFPGINLNVEGIPIIIWTVIALFSIQPSTKASLFQLPVFWVSVGMLVYYSGGFFFNFIYQYLINDQTEVAKDLNGLINKGLNNILYICLIISFLCSNHLRKYSMR